MCPDPAPCTARRRARGLVTVELALCLTVFFLLTLGTIEIARMLYVFNTVQDVTRAAARAASMTDFSNAAAMTALRQRALFRASPGALPLMPNLTDAQVRIEYLSMTADGTLAPVNPPACPAANLRQCTLNRYGPTCIRAVRASICGNADGDCEPLPFAPITGVLPGLSNLTVPVSATLVKAESLGYRPGVNNCL